MLPQPLFTLTHHGAVTGVTGACHELTLHGPGGAKSGPYGNEDAKTALATKMRAVGAPRVVLPGSPIVA